MQEAIVCDRLRVVCDCLESLDYFRNKELSDLLRKMSKTRHLEPKHDSAREYDTRAILQRNSHSAKAMNYH